MDNFIGSRPLPAINTFRQFNRPLSMLSPLDLSLRSSASIPITPPSTPSPPRKRQILMSSEENHFWRPHTMMGFTDSGAQFMKNYTSEFHNNYDCSATHIQKFGNQVLSVDEEKDKSQFPDSLHRAVGEIRNLLSEGDTIVLTEDEDEDDVGSVKDVNAAEDDDEEYVDILSNDDELISLQFAPAENKEQPVLENGGKFLTRNKLVYDDKDLHKQAVDGLAKLFEGNLQSSNEKSQKIYTDLSAALPNSSRPTQTSDESNPQSTSQTNNFTQQFSVRANKSEKKRMKVRKQQQSTLDEDTISPVSGTIIRKLREDEELVVRKGDIDPAFNVVEITEEAKATIASIENKIGEYLCQLCRTLYDDAFQLAQHRCPRIVHIEYKCSECEKVFNCPANLASHRRWHKPKSDGLLSNREQQKKSISINENNNKAVVTNQSSLSSAGLDSLDGIFACRQCGKSFRRHAYLKKHQLSHQMINELSALSSIRQSSSSGHLPSHTNFVSLHSMNHPSNLTCQSPYYQPGKYNNSYHQQRFSTFTFPQRMYSLGDFYFPQNVGRVSAFQYVHNPRHPTPPASANPGILNIRHQIPLQVK